MQRRQRVRHLVVDRAHHLLGRDAVGHQRRDQRAGAGPDVDVELVDRPVGRQQIERPQRPDLVDAAGEAAPAQHERGPGGAPAPPRPTHSSRPHCSQRASLRGRDFCPAAGFRRLERRMARLFALAVLLVLLLAPGARAADLAATQRVLAREMARSGAYSGAYVVDVGTGQELYSYRADVGRVPASVEKLYTSATALLNYGAEGRLTTSVLATALPDETGTIVGDVVLRGGGDPTFGTAAASALAEPARRGRAGADRRAGDRRRVGLRRLPRPVELTHRVLGRPAQRALVQPRAHRQAAPVLPGQPGPVRGAGVREGAQAPGRADHREGPRRHHAGGDDAVLGVELAAGRVDRAPDEPAVGQLHRRDADEGARVPVRHGRLDRRRRRRGASDGAALRHRAHDRRRLGPLALQPHHAAPGRAAADGHGRLRGRGRVRPVARGRGPQRHAGQADARHRRRRTAAGPRPAR